MKILAIETSCDDTGIAILEVLKNQDFKVLANIVSSQTEVHKQYGGVFPVMAKREHIKNLPIVLEKALKEAKISNPKKEINFIAVTNGPGLEPCLWTGVNFAKDLSRSFNLPIVEVNHIEGHILVNYLENKEVEFPAVALVVSGGHTQIILMKKLGRYEILGETRDDAAGECFDKCAKILGLEYPGGPVISKLAEGIKPQNILPRPMMNSTDYDFSFSGLKTAVLYAWKKMENGKIFDERQKIIHNSLVSQMASEVQQAIIDVLLKKTIKAVKDFKAKTLILGGGVTANKELRTQFKNKLAKKSPNTKFLVPSPNLSIDNGLIAAIAGYFKAKQNKFSKWQDIEAKANLRVE